MLLIKHLSHFANNQKILNRDKPEGWGYTSKIKFFENLKKK